MTLSVHLTWLHHHASSALNRCSGGSLGACHLGGTNHWRGHSAHHLWLLGLLWSLLLVSGNHHWVLLFLEAACLVASAATDTDADTDDDGDHYKSDSCTNGSLCGFLTSFFPFGVPFVFPCVVKDICVLIAKNVFF